MKDLQLSRRNHVREAVSVRKKFKKYFVSNKGSVLWQWNIYIKSGTINNCIK